MNDQETVEYWLKCLATGEWCASGSHAKGLRDYIETLQRDRDKAETAVCALRGELAEDRKKFRTLRGILRVLLQESHSQHDIGDPATCVDDVCRKGAHALETMTVPDSVVTPPAVPVDGDDEFCGCASDEAIGLLRALLERVDALKSGADPQEEMLRLLLDEAGLLEHGTSARCGWLTERGKQFLARIRERQ